MATRRDLSVTLSHEDAEAVSKMLIEYANHNASHARTTKSAAIRSSCERWAADARQQADRIARNLWTWEG